MKNFKKVIIATLALFLVSTVAQAVLNEKDLPRTLSVLKSELAEQNRRMEQSRGFINKSNSAQHKRMMDMIEKCNELSLMLYSQNQDYTFDLTYSLKQGTRQYEEYNKKKVPFDAILSRMDLEIDRYERLIEALRRIPPMLEDMDEIPDSLKLHNVMAASALEADSLALHHHHDHDHAHAVEETAEHLEHLNGHASDDDHDELGMFQLDEQGQADRDSCMIYARNLLKMYQEAHERIIRDSEHYTSTSGRLKETYDYAQKRYVELQKKIFIDGQDSYITVLKQFRFYAKRAFTEARNKYTTSFDGTKSMESDWRGPVVAGFIVYVLIYLLIAVFLSNIIIRIATRFNRRLREEASPRRRLCYNLLLGSLIFAITIYIADLFVDQNFFREASGLLLTYAWLLIVIFSSMLVHMDNEEMQEGLKLYIPILLLSIIVITFRIIFIPNRLVNLVFPPILLVFFIWQLCLGRKLKANKFDKVDVVIYWISAAVMGATMVAAFCGYVLMGIQILIWWLFQLTAVQTIAAAAELLTMYERNIVKRKLQKRYHKVTKEKARSGEYIRETWILDLLRMAIVPMAAILSLPLCIYLAVDIFDLTAICKTIFEKPFFDITDVSGNPILHLSLYKLVIFGVLFYLFRFLTYATRAIYKRYKIAKERRESGQEHILDNQVNLTLANNIINILLWGLFVIISVSLFKIPMGAISVIAAGLATGIGLALKDVLNNFIYGIQLMSGRVRVGDIIECDGMRGKVESITYQSTQIVTLQGALLSITNTSLFNDTFKNLTRTSPYEYVGIEVGVSYGTDVKKVCEILKTELEKFHEQDKYGRDIVDPDYGIKVLFSDFGDSSVNLIVKQFVVVEQEPYYIPIAKETIYNTLNANGVEIPFPQRDIHIKNN